jgi:hypothetical protein
MEKYAANENTIAYAAVMPGGADCSHAVIRLLHISIQSSANLARLADCQLPHVV